MNAAYYHRRTAKRLESAKHKARSELNKCGWATEGYSSKGIVDMCVKDLPDTIERVDALNMTYKEFVDRFERYNQPVILTGITEKWQANQKWTIQRLHRKYRNQKFKCGEDDDGYSVKLKMKYYIDYMLNNDDDSPLYIFDSSFGDRNKTSKLLEDYEVPVMFKDDLFRYAADKRRPPHRWFVMGPARSGTGIHIDPLGTSAWNALILGHKRWCLIHPSAPKALVKPIKEECGKHPDEAITWFHTVYNRVVAPSWYKEFPVIHAVQNAGEVMFVPSGWWHVVVNLDDTIAITQNFCSITNLSVVWPKTVKGRPRLSTHWYRAIKKHRPELIPCIEEINRSHNWRSAVEDDSSDSSSSSSSSDSGSSDSEPENLVRSKVEPLGDSSEKCTVNGTTKNNVLSQGDENTMNSNNVQRLGAMENGGGGHIAGIRKRRLSGEKDGGKHSNSGSEVCASKFRRSPAPSKAFRKMVLRFPLTLLFLFLIFNNSFIVIAEEGEISNENVVSTGNEGEPRPPSRSPVSEENSEKPAEEDEKNSAFEKEDDVYILTDDNFDKFLEKNPTTFIEFYAPWCGHCKKLAPEYSIAARILRPSVLLAKLDATVQKKVAEKYEVKSYPTLKLFKEGEEMPIDFDGERDSSSIVQWVQLKTDPNYKPPKEEVITLTAENFDEFVADKPIMLVEFYAPWCGHCKQLAPEYEQAAKLLKPHNIPLAKVDATVEKKLADQYGVQGYPTLKILRNGRRFDYNGPRNAFGILNHMMLQASPAATELKTLKKVKSFMPAEDVAIIGFFEVDEGKYFEVFMDAAEKTRNDFTVGYTKSDALRQHFNAKKNSIVVFYPELFHSKFEPKSVAFERDPDDDLTEEDLVAFWQEHSTPLVGKKTRNNAATRYAKLPLVVVYYNADFSLQYREGSEYWRKKVLNVANKFKSQNFKFAVADEEEFTRELNDLGLGDSGLEHNVVVFGVDGKKYPMIGEEYEDGDLEENLTSFLNNINKGKVKPYVKSAPVPKSDSGPVRTLVGSNFAKIVNDDSKDVLIEFYAPWCGHCQNFEPKYKQFAAKLKKERPNLIVAKMDATANDAPSEYAIEGFPTIYLAPSGKKDKPIKYTGNRELADLEKFVHENSVVSFLTAKEEL